MAAQSIPTAAGVPSATKASVETRIFQRGMGLRFRNPGSGISKGVMDQLPMEIQIQIMETLLGGDMGKYGLEFFERRLEEIRNSDYHKQAMILMDIRTYPSTRRRPFKPVVPLSRRLTEEELKERNLGALGSRDALDIEIARAVVTTPVNKFIAEGSKRRKIQGGFELSPRYKRLREVYVQVERTLRQKIDKLTSLENSFRERIDLEGEARKGALLRSMEETKQSLQKSSDYLSFLTLKIDLAVESNIVDQAGVDELMFEELGYYHNSAVTASDEMKAEFDEKYEQARSQEEALDSWARHIRTVASEIPMNTPFPTITDPATGEQVNAMEYVSQSESFTSRESRNNAIDQLEYIQNFNLSIWQAGGMDPRELQLQQLRLL